MTRHLLDITDLSCPELLEVLDAAVDPAPDPVLEGRGAALLFNKPSARTRHSTEMAVVALGGHPIYVGPEEVGIDERETAEDVARTMSAYHHLIGARVHDHSVLDRMALAGSVPVVNLLSDRSHPLQALADMLTMESALGPIAGRRVAWVGDYNNVARSLGEICALLGAHVAFACPPGFAPDGAELERIALLGAASVQAHHRPADAVRGADAVHADTWVSMGQEDEKAGRVRAFEGFTVDESMMSAAAPDAVFMHCMPAYRGLEVTSDVIDGPRSRVFEQGHARLPAARGALAFLLGVRR